MTITVKDFMECTQHKVSETAQYMWACYGNHAQHMDYWNGKHDETGFSISIVYDTVTQVVYEMEAWDYNNEREYRWINPDYAGLAKKEAKRRGVKNKQSIDGRKYIELDVAGDMLKKASAIVAGEVYDDRVEVELDLEDALLFEMMKMAHTRDMTLNQFVEYILTQAIAQHKAA